MPMIKSAIPVTMLTAHGEDVDRIVGLEIGADESTELFMPEGDHRIDAHGAASGDVTGSHRNTEENDGHGAKRQRIGRRNFIKQAGHQAREQKRSHGSDA